MTRALAVIAKAPAAGRSKTRLCPPLSLEEAAILARAALTDTLAAVASTPAERRVLVLDGEPGPWLPAGIEVIAQRGAGLAERLTNAFADIADGAVIIGMDTPQVGRDLLAAALDGLSAAAAVLGPAEDGGYWAIGLNRPDPRALAGIPMSRGDTLAAQRARLLELGLSVVELPILRDVDTYDDALAAAHLAPRTEFARALGAMRRARTAA